MDAPNSTPRRSRVLALLPGVPLPANTGGALRALTTLRALDQAFDTTVLTWARDGEDRQALDRMLEGRLHVVERTGPVDSLFAEGMGFVLGCPAGYCRYGWFPSVLKRLLESEKFDFIHFDHPHTALTWPQVKRMQPQALLVLDAHNIEAEIMERLARNLDLVFPCSEKDAVAFREMGARRVRVVPNAIPPLPAPLVAQRQDVVFVGSLDWRPNADAAALLAKEIWPRCRALLPGARLVIVGRNPPLAIQALGSRDVLVEGSVPSVRPYLDRAFATAIPLRAGSGTRIKILEAWAAGVPVIASRIAAEGLPYSDGKDLILAEEPGEFARGLVRLWRDQQLAETLAREGRRTVEPFTAEKIGEMVARDYRELLDPESARSYNDAYAPAMAATP